MGGLGDRAIRDARMTGNGGKWETFPSYDLVQPPRDVNLRTIAQQGTVANFIAYFSPKWHLMLIITCFLKNMAALGKPAFQRQMELVLDRLHFS